MAGNDQQKPQQPKQDDAAKEHPVGDAELAEEAVKDKNGGDRSKLPGRTFDV
ncbi:MAG TPA: hypothetical protein VED40_21045 [Azospirillaceae bacterium]|nr:hypothetical protein [Azospirillaceae bacterium]